VRHTVVIRSTILPGTMHKMVIPTLEEFSGKKAGIDFGVCNNPEFLWEGSALKDFRHPPKTVIGELEQASGDILAALYEKLDAPLIRTNMESAEMVKYVDNSGHGLKIGFANEIGNLCKSLGLDVHAVMNIFCQDRKLNISPRTCCPVLRSEARAYPKIFGRCPIRQKCTICSCRFLLPFYPATKCRSLGASSSLQKRAIRGSAFWVSVSKRAQTICERAR
jgi:GDP-mannose 6-dehydrogenase